MVETPKYYAGIQYLQNKDGIVFISNPQLLKRTDMTAFYPPQHLIHGSAAAAPPAPPVGVGLSLPPPAPIEKDEAPAPGIKPAGELTRSDIGALKKPELVDYLNEAGIEFDTSDNFMSLKKRLRVALKL